MKEFDFVKLTLWLSLVLTAGLAGCYFWFGHKTDQVRDEIKKVERISKDVGAFSRDIAMLEFEKRNDKTPDTSEAGIFTFFGQAATPSSIHPNEDYGLVPKDPAPNEKARYVDQAFNINFKKDRPKGREQLIAFIFNVETQSHRIKMQRLKLDLVQDRALQDLWVANELLFVRRDPLRGEPK